MNSLGLPFAVEPKIRPSSLMPRPHVLLLVERRNSTSVTRTSPSFNRDPLGSASVARPSLLVDLLFGGAVPSNALLRESRLNDASPSTLNRKKPIRNDCEVFLPSS